MFPRCVMSAFFLLFFSIDLFVQYKWLENDLASVDRKRTPWVILTGHRPMYVRYKYFIIKISHNFSSENCTDDPTASDYIVAIHMQESFEDLLYKYRVDLAFWGHYHSYERTCAVYKQMCTPGTFLGNFSFKIWHKCPFR